MCNRLEVIISLLLRPFIEVRDKMVTWQAKSPRCSVTLVVYQLAYTVTIEENRDVEAKDDSLFP